MAVKPNTVFTVQHIQQYMIANLNSIHTGNPANPAVIILHGLFGSSSNWRTVAAQLGNHFRVLCVDLRNHGKSEWRSSMSYLDMAQDLVAFIHDNHLDKPHLIGHSMGGKTVMTCLQHCQPEVGKCVVVDIAPAYYSHDHDELIDALKKLDLESIHSRNDADQMLAMDIASAPIRQFLLQNLIRTGGGFAWRINLEAITNNRDLLFGYPDGHVSDAEILFVRGSNSDYILPGHYEMIARQFPNSSIKTMANAGHWLHAEKPGELTEWLFEFLD